MWKLGEGEFDWALELAPPQRYAYAVNKIKEHGELWILDSSEGYCLAKGETGEPGLPVWPHPEFAQEHATGDWAEGFVESISLKAWLEMAATSLPEPITHVAVFFTHLRGNPFSAVQVPPEKFAADLRAPKAKLYQVPTPAKPAV